MKTIIYICKRNYLGTIKEKNMKQKILALLKNKYKNLGFRY